MARRRRLPQTAAPPRRWGEMDPWLDEVAVALDPLGFGEYTRNQHRVVGGVSCRGDIHLRSRFMELGVAWLGSEQATHRAEMSLRADVPYRRELERGARALVHCDGVLFLAASLMNAVDEVLLDEAVRTVDRLPVDGSLRARPASSSSPAAPSPPSPGDDPIEQLRRVSQLHSDGIIDDAEFAEKKASLLKRV